MGDLMMNRLLLIEQSIFFFFSLFLSFVLLIIEKP